MYKILVVRIFQCRAKLNHKRVQSVPTKKFLRLSGTEFLEVGALYVFHRDKSRFARGLVEIMDAHDVRMAQGLAFDGFAAEIVERHFVVGDFGREKFEGDFPIQAHVLREPDDTCSAATKFMDEGEALGEFASGNQNH